ncbi:HNH endonuclease [Flavobacterium sp. CAU 1735]|uniref:HNH endonuclease n=1 Tax=Flavobacterium sp. CAU 1735 TaxID=3140361 RepID=UPI0032607372
MSRYKKAFAPRAVKQEKEKSNYSQTGNAEQVKITDQDATIRLNKNEMTKLTYEPFLNQAFKKIENGQAFLKFSENGQAVLILNKALKKLGYTVDNEAIFLSETQYALIAFQYEHNIATSIILDATTLLKLDEVLTAQEKSHEENSYKNEQTNSEEKSEQTGGETEPLPDAAPEDKKIRLGVGIIPMDIKSDRAFFDFLDKKIFGEITDIKWDIGKKTYKDYIGKDISCTVQVSILKEYLKITDAQWEDMMNKSTGSTLVAADLRKSVENYLAKVKDREEALNERDILDTKLFGLEAFYRDYSAYKNALMVSGAIKLHEWGSELEKKAKQYGFKDLQDFENTINAYVDAFRDETVRMADDYISKYEHMLYKEEERLKQEGVLTKLYTAFAKSGAAKKIKDGNDKILNSRIVSDANDPQEKKMKMNESLIEEMRKEGEVEMTSGIEQIKSLDSFLFKDKTFDHKKLAEVGSQKEFETFLFDFIKSKQESAKNVRQDLKKNPDAVFKREELLALSYQQQGVVKDSINDLAIQQRISDIKWTNILINIGLAVASIVVIVATWGAATPYVIAGTAVSLGMSAYNVYEALDEYSKDYDAYAIGLLKDEPSYAWVVVAIAGAALDAASFAAVFRAAKPITEAADIFNKSSKTAEDVLKLKTALEKIKQLAPKVRANIVKQAELTAEFDRVGLKIVQPGQVQVVAMGIDSAALSDLLQLARIGIKRGIVSFRSFLMELQLRKIIKSADNLTEKELKILKEAFENAKSGKFSLEDLANYLSSKHKDFLEKRNFKLIKPTKNPKNLDIIHDGTIMFRGTEEHIEKYISFMSKSDSERKAIVEAANGKLKSNKSVYKPESTLKKGYEVPASKNGTSPDFKGLNMYVNEQGRLGNGMSIPNVSEEVLNDALNKIIKFDGEVKVPITGIEYSSDFANAWNAVGIEPSLGSKILRELDLTWHHLDDLDENLKSTMQLVRKGIHEKTKLHMGSQAQIKAVLGIK